MPSGVSKDIRKGQRTGTDYINGCVYECGVTIGVEAKLHGAINELVERVERG